MPTCFPVRSAGRSVKSDAGSWAGWPLSVALRTVQKVGCDGSAARPPQDYTCVRGRGIGCGRGSRVGAGLSQTRGGIGVGVDWVARVRRVCGACVGWEWVVCGAAVGRVSGWEWGALPRIDMHKHAVIHPALPIKKDCRCSRQRERTGVRRRGGRVRAAWAWPRVWGHAWSCVVVRVPLTSTSYTYHCPLLCHHRHL